MDFARDYWEYAESLDVSLGYASENNDYHADIYPVEIDSHRLHCSFKVSRIIPETLGIFTT